MLENTNVLPIIDMDEPPEGSINIEVTKEKPFNKCLQCEYLGNGCSIAPQILQKTPKRRKTYYEHSKRIFEKSIG